MSMKKRVEKELNDIRKENDDLMIVSSTENNNHIIWIGTIKGPKNTPYESGTFDFKVNFPSNYPFKPPEIFFLTKIFHMNVNLLRGEVNCCIIRNGWNPGKTVKKILYDLFNNTDYDKQHYRCSGNDIELLNKCLEDKEFYKKTAIEWTKKYANKEYREKEELNDEINKKLNSAENEIFQSFYKIKEFYDEKFNEIKNLHKTIDELKEQFKDNNINDKEKLNDLKNEIDINTNKIKEFKNNFILSKEKLMSVIFTTIDKKDYHSIICQKNDLFSSVKETLLDKYPQYKNKNISFIINNEIIIDEKKTIEENNIKDNNLITILI